MSHLVGRRAAFGLAATALALPALPARAQTINRTARAVIGFPAGGSSDVVARLYAEKLRGTFAPTVIVEGRVGASGRIAIEFVRDAEKDGSAYLQTPASIITLLPHVFPREARYNALTDLAPVSSVCSFPFAMAVPMNHPARNLQEFVAWLKAQPNEVPYASPAAGSAPHFLGVMFGKEVGARLTHVPYRGAVPAIQDLVGGRLPMFIGVMGDISPQQGTGARMLAMTGEQRHPRYPDLPTFRELGYPNMTRSEWFGVLLPAGTPAPIVNGLHQGIVAASRTPEIVAALDRLEYLPTTSASPAAFVEEIRKERDDWARIVRESGFQPEN